jgi:hypothetical protein
MPPVPALETRLVGGRFIPKTTTTISASASDGKAGPPTIPKIDVASAERRREFASGLELRGA